MASQMGFKTHSELLRNTGQDRTSVRACGLMFLALDHAPIKSIEKTFALCTT